MANPPRPAVWKLGWLNPGTAFGWPESPTVPRGTVVGKNQCEVAVILPDGKSQARWAPGTEVVIIRSPKPAVPVVPAEKPQDARVSTTIAPEPRFPKKATRAPRKQKAAPAARLRKATAKGKPQRAPNSLLS